MPLPVAFDGFIEQSKRVSPTCLICFEREEDQEMVQWTVSPTQGCEPCRASGLRGPIGGHGPFAPIANRPISLRIYPDRLVVVRKARRMAQAVTDLIDRARVRHGFKNPGEGRASLQSMRRVSK